MIVVANFAYILLIQTHNHLEHALPFCGKGGQNDSRVEISEELFSQQEMILRPKPI
jgi:hypothetical protein